MAFLPSIALSGPAAFQQFTRGNFNASGAADRYKQAFINRSVLAPIGVKQIGPFAFDYQGDDTVDMNNDVTDHFLEDNTAVQDHIGVRPITVTMRGLISELALAQSVANSISAALASVENQLSQASAYLGAYTPGVTQRMFAAITQAQNLAIQVEQAAARAAQIASFFFPGPAQLNRLQAGYAELNSLYKAGTLFTVFTPFETFDNMAITSIKAVQPERSKTVADVTVTMKQLRFVQNIQPSAYQAQYGGNAANNWQSPTASGTTTGLPRPLSAVQLDFPAR